MKLAFLVSGPSGSGKSTWIRNRALSRGARLIRHSIRTDRSLRQGRAYLFSQHRSKEPTLIWLEGADTLTTDAQAFLRRILETATSNVEFALEVRDEVTMNPPLLSRCLRICMPNISFRKQDSIQQLEKRGYGEIRKIRHNLEQKMRVWSPGFTVKEICVNIQHARQYGYFPDVLLHKELKSVTVDEQIYYYKKFGDGINLWLILTELALKRVLAKPNETNK
uniref:ATPase AAA-type core domain-containing protein n=1 Tax=viral metagenome TaxID=1070528 RepID=A0A6C0HG20_9ZZZZ